MTRYPHNPCQKFVGVVIAIALLLDASNADAGVTNTIINRAVQTEQGAIQIQGSRANAMAQASLQRAIAYRHLIPNNLSGVPKKASLPQVMLFVSLGMPTTLLRQYVTEAHALSVPLVLRGFIDNDLKKTTSRIHDILTDSKTGQKIIGGFVVDPIWYRRYAITVVPTLIVSTGTNKCLPNANCIPPQYDQIAGNLSIHELLQRIARQGDAASFLAAERLKKVGGSP